MIQPASVKVLTELLARLEAAAGPDREVDADLGHALGWYQATYDRMFIWNDAKGLHQSINPTPFTASLDAALVLVERVLPGWGVKLEAGLGHGISATVGHVGERNLYDRPEGWAKGPSLAVAVLRALLDALISQSRLDAERPSEPQEGPVNDARK